MPPPSTLLGPLDCSTFGGSGISELRSLLAPVAVVDAGADDAAVVLAAVLPGADDEAVTVAVVVAVTVALSEDEPPHAEAKSPTAIPATASAYGVLRIIPPDCPEHRINAAARISGVESKRII